MSVLDVEQLLEPISSELPCGEDLEYDLEFGALEQAAQPVAEQQFGDTVVEGQEPDWKEVHRKALGLFTRTKDLRVAVLLARAVLRTDGLAGFCDAIEIVRTLVERYWQEVHPRLDPDDDNDPMMRVNALCALCDKDACLQAVEEAPLVMSMGLGKFSYRDHLVASGELALRNEESAVEMSTIEAAFLDAEAEDLQQRAEALQAAIEHTESLETALTKEVGVANAASFAPLADLLKKMAHVLAEQMQRRGIADTAGEASEDGQAAPGTDAAAKPAAFDEVRSRDDVIRLLDKICVYYDQHEPSSPLPLLLQRAKRIVTMDFMELLRDIAPDAIEQAESVVGASEDGEDGVDD